MRRAETRIAVGVGRVTAVASFARRVRKGARPPFSEGGELSTQLFQLAVDPRQLGPRLLFPQVALAMQGPGEILDLAAEQPQPRVPVHRGGPVLQLARLDRREDLILRQAVLLASRLVAQRRALASPFSIVEVHVRPLSTDGRVR